MNDLPGVCSARQQGMVSQLSSLSPRSARSSERWGFWDDAIRQDDLRKAIKLTLDASNLFNFPNLDELSVELVTLAKVNRHRL